WLWCVYTNDVYFSCYSANEYSNSHWCFSYFNGTTLYQSAPGYWMTGYKQPQVLLLIMVVLFSFLPEALWVFRPEIESDALSYHLPYAKQFAENQGLLVNTYLRYPLNAFNFDLLYAVG